MTSKWRLKINIKGGKINKTETINYNAATLDGAIDYSAKRLKEKQAYFDRVAPGFYTTSGTFSIIRRS